MHIQTVATGLQFVGGLVGVYGLWHAWNRITGQLDRLQKGIVRLRNTVASDLEVALHEYVPPDNKDKVAPALHGHGELSAAIEVKMPGTPEERLHVVENQLARLPGQVAKDINAAIATALEGHEAQEKVFGVKDKCLALTGAVFALFGTLLRLLDQLSVLPK
ncbi:MAG: hypothetical protein ACLP4W_30065 [Mycobacterium sp.]|uniref:hypothetical protein n=1 Tax=Mycobacterium sp. TaxID=1785 RepID=UPI003F99E1BF